MARIRRLVGTGQRRASFYLLDDTARATVDGREMNVGDAVTTMREVLVRPGGVVRLIRALGYGQDESRFEALFDDRLDGGTPCRTTVRSTWRCRLGPRRECGTDGGADCRRWHRGRGRCRQLRATRRMASLPRSFVEGTAGRACSQSTMTSLASNPRVCEGAAGPVELRLWRRRQFHCIWPPPLSPSAPASTWCTCLYRGGAPARSRPTSSPASCS